MCLAQGHNSVTPVRLEPLALRSRVKHSTTKPLRSLCSILTTVNINICFGCVKETSHLAVSLHTQNLMFDWGKLARQTNFGGALLFSACLSVRCRGHSNLIIFNSISPKFHIWIASIKLSCFAQRRITKMADKMAAAYQCLLSWSL